ncbi:MAG: hypothetical protein ACE5D3_05615 [Candidatus Binatia bacterium]
MFDDKKGQCFLKTSGRLESPCSTGTGIDCFNLTFKAKCSGILDPDGLNLTAGGGWALNTVMRITMNDSTGGNMTVMDLPAQFGFSQAFKGRMSLMGDTNTLLDFLFSGPGFELPGCTSIEVVWAAVADPSGGIFARMGASTR